MHRNSSRIQSALVVFGALLCVSAFPNAAHSQPTNGVLSESKIVVTDKNDSLSVDLHVQAVLASQVINELARKTNTDFILYADAEIDYLDFKNPSPLRALEKVADSAGLSVQLVGKTYLIDKKIDGEKSKNDGLEMVFRDIGIRELLETLGQQFDLKIEIAPDVSGQLAAIRLNDETPASAVEKVARGVKLNLEITKDGVYRVGFDAPATPQN